MTAMQAIRLRGGAALAGAVALLLAGCASPPEPPPPRTAAIALSAGPGVNPTAEGTPAPVVVQVFALRQPAAFQGAGYFAIADDPRAVLGPDLAANARVILQPGEAEALDWTLAEDVTHLAVVAGFRDLDRAEWRALAPVPAEPRASAWAVTVSGRSVGLEAR